MKKTSKTKANVLEDNLKVAMSRVEGAMSEASKLANGQVNLDKAAAAKISQCLEAVDHEQWVLESYQSICSSRGKPENKNLSALLERYKKFTKELNDVKVKKASTSDLKDSVGRQSDTEGSISSDDFIIVPHSVDIDEPQVAIDVDLQGQEGDVRGLSLVNKKDLLDNLVSECKIKMAEGINKEGHWEVQDRYADLHHSLENLLAASGGYELAREMIGKISNDLYKVKFSSRESAKKYIQSVIAIDYARKLIEGTEVKDVQKSPDLKVDVVAGRMVDTKNDMRAKKHDQVKEDNSLELSSGNLDRNEGPIVSESDQNELFKSCQEVMASAKMNNRALGEDEGRYDAMGASLESLMSSQPNGLATAWALVKDMKPHLNRHSNLIMRLMGEPTKTYEAVLGVIAGYKPDSFDALSEQDIAAIAEINTELKAQGFFDQIDIPNDAQSPRPNE